MLTKDFYMRQYTITNAQYAVFFYANAIRSDGKWAMGTWHSIVYVGSMGLQHNCSNKVGERIINIHNMDQTRGRAV